MQERNRRSDRVLPLRMSDPSLSGQRPIVVVTHEIPGRLNVPGAEIRQSDVSKQTRADVLRMIHGASFVVTMYFDKVDSEFLDAAGSGLKGVCNFAVGYDNIDVALCKQRGVKVANTPGAVTEGTADLAWALILACARRLIEADRFARTDEYARRGPLGITEFLGMDLTGRTLLIVGAGRIGYATALRSIGWGMRVLYVARSRHLDFELAPLAARRVSLEEGLREADVVSVHTPLTSETRHIIDAKAISQMKPTSILINTSRGPTVDEGALVAALKERRIWGAGLDVFEHEPRLHPGLAELTNVVLAPHIGSAETKYRLLMTEMVSENARAVLSGREPINPVY
ncbi:MAG: D-glycerate dehydrogenase [Phycisphaeraceae bacterium]|nr:D-glycerate dehydrogenase [Phycisphaeraceae bacterium]MBX3366180.1 D-glycerate dehydrogenase [Phycisphaeraceae bacterium]